MQMTANKISATGVHEHGYNTAFIACTFFFETAHLKDPHTTAKCEQNRYGNSAILILTRKVALALTTMRRT